MSEATALAAVTIPDHDHDRDYAALEQALAAGVAAATAGAQALFRTDAAGLFDLYLDSLPAERQVHDCSACRRFIETYGGLVSVEDDGRTRSVIWTCEAPAFYVPAVATLSRHVERARIVSVFRSREETWGTPVTGDWRHLHARPAMHLVHRERARTPGQAMAASRENLRVVATALGEFKPRLLDEALRILRADAVARADRFVTPVQWLRDLHDRPKGRPGENLLWRAIATAPEGYLHPRAAVTGSLLEDIAAGLPMADIARRFAAKVHPLQYQRPQAPPSAGNVAAAEALFARLGLEPALHRRFARLEDLSPFWTPPAKATADPPAGGGSIFGHLKTKEADATPSVTLPVQTLTWDKFRRTVLPTAEAIALKVPAHGSFLAMTAPVHADAPPLLKWDRDDARNGLAWYVYHNGSPAHQWRLTPNAWTPVTAITDFPNMYGDKPMPFLSTGAILVLEGAVDGRSDSLALFPECLRDDLHAVRATIEAFSAGAKLEGQAEASACGYDLRRDACACELRVTTAGGAHADYRIDRWD